MIPPNRLAHILRRLATYLLVAAALAACEDDDPLLTDPLVSARPAPRTPPAFENHGERRPIYLKASNAAQAASFGTSLSISADGTRLAVGARRESSSAEGAKGTSARGTSFGSGAVYVFSRAGNTWTQEAFIKGSNTAANDHFGTSVSLSADGSRLAVGAFQESSRGRGVGAEQAQGGGDYSGAAYVFTRTGTTWQEEAFIKASNADDSDGFGDCVVLSADGARLAVAAMSEASRATGIDGDQGDNSAVGAGAVYVFTRSAEGWAQEAYIKASNTRWNSSFGSGLSISGDGSRLAVGASSEGSSATGVGGDQADRGALSSGAVYTFTRSGSRWAQDAYIKASDTAAGGYFGSEVALSADGSRLAVGAMNAMSRATGINLAGSLAPYEPQPSSGAVYVFSQSGASWTQEFKASTGEMNGGFGTSVSLSNDGTRLAVGAGGESSNARGVSEGILSTSRESGAAHLFSRVGATWAHVGHIKAPNTGPHDAFGHAIALSGDGARLVVGAPFEDSSAIGVDGNDDDDRAADSGAVYAYWVRSQHASARE